MLSEAKHLKCKDSVNDLLSFDIPRKGCIIEESIKKAPNRGFFGYMKRLTTPQSAYG